MKPREHHPSVAYLGSPLLDWRPRAAPRRWPAFVAGFLLGILLALVVAP